jgi:hypothetical protein
MFLKQFCLYIAELDVAKKFLDQQLSSVKQ